MVLGVKGPEFRVHRTPHYIWLSMLFWSMGGWLRELWFV